MSVSIDQIKELRDATGAGIMDAKSALENTQGDMEQAKKALFEKGLQKANKRAANESSQGTVAAYIHGGGQIGVLVELRCETDFVARTDDFQTLAREIAMQIAAMNPQYLDQGAVPADKVDEAEGTVLLDQPFFKDPAITVGERIKEFSARVGENVQVGKFHRLSIGQR